MGKLFLKPLSKKGSIMKSKQIFLFVIASFLLVAFSQTVSSQQKNLKHPPVGDRPNHSNVEIPEVNLPDLVVQDVQFSNNQNQMIVTIKNQGGKAAPHFPYSVTVGCSVAGSSGNWQKTLDCPPIEPWQSLSIPIITHPQNFEHTRVIIDLDLNNSIAEFSENNNRFKLVNCPR
jgi:hypothetical protein